ncbi:MAG: glycoside hydrolase family 28 protein [Bacteroidales bacterium]
MTTRREFLKALGAGLVVSACPAPAWARLQSGARPDLLAGATNPWSALPRMLARIAPPTFPARDFDLTRFGAVGDNRTDNTAALRAAIAACQRAGGGRVVVPAGQFITGAIELKSRVNLHLDDRATLRFTRDASKYPVVVTRFEGMECMNYAPFIRAFQQENVAVTGGGTIDGNSSCEHWWPWKGRTNCGWKAGEPKQDADRQALVDMVERGVPVKERVFGPGHYLRPQFIQPYRSNNVLIEGVRLVNSPMWQVHPVLCTNVIVKDLSIQADGPNTDGCNPESCTDVLIKNCYFDTGDDCIAIKSGRNADGRRLNAPSRNIVIQGCRMRNGHGGITVGSEISGGVSGVFAEDCTLDSPLLDHAVRIKNNAVRGGLVQNIFVRNLDIGEVAQAALTIDFYYEEADKGRFTPIARNVVMEKVKTRKAQYALYLRGFANAPVGPVSLVDCNFDGVQKGSVLEHADAVTVRNVRVNGTLVDRMR